MLYTLCVYVTDEEMNGTYRKVLVDKVPFLRYEYIFYEKDSAAFVMSLEYFSKRLFIIHSICS
jgi:hypothetical protein